MTIDQRKQYIEWFLRKHDAWDNYLEAIEKYRFKIEYPTMEDAWNFSLNSTREDDVFQTFGWTNTPQGTEYWSDLISKWFKLFKRFNN